LVCQNPIGDDCPRDRQQRQDRYDRDGLHLVNVAPECGRKRQSFVPFRDNGGICSWPGVSFRPFSSETGTRFAPQCPPRAARIW
jgi:hypothetical protein